jgi:hypothetical protein
MNKDNLSKEEIMKYICSNLGENLEFFKNDEIKKLVSGSEECRQLLKSLDITIECYRNYNVEVSKESHDKLIDYLGLNE